MEEVRGSFGQVIGSREYFKGLNDNVKLSGVLKNNSDGVYLQNLTYRNEEIKRKLKEICSDLETNISIIRYIPKNNREELLNFITGLNDYLKFDRNGDQQIFTQSKIILDLTDRRTSFKSGATQSQIEEIVKKIYEGTKTFPSYANERIRLVEKACKDGLKNAIHNAKPLEQAFLYELTGRYDEKILQDALAEYKNKHTYRGIYKGACGRNIGSKEYSKYYEQLIFGNNLDSSISEKYNYRKNIIAKLKILADYIQIDLDQTVTEEARKKLLSVISDFQKCGLQLHLTYHGNAQMIKPKVTEHYEILLTQQETEKILDALVFGAENKESIAGVILFLITKKIPSKKIKLPQILKTKILKILENTSFGLTLYSIFSGEDSMEKDAKKFREENKHKRLMIIIETLSDQNFNEIEAQSIEMHFVDERRGR